MENSRRFFLTTLFKTAVAVPLIGTGTSVFLDSTKVFKPRWEWDKTTIDFIFDQGDTFYKHLERYNKVIITSRDMRIPLKLRPGGLFCLTNIVSSK